MERLFQILKGSATPMPIADATRVGVGMPNVARALGLQAADSSVGTSPAPGQSDPAIEMWPTPIEALTQKASSPSPFTTASFGTPPFAPMSFGLQSFDTVVAPPTTTLDNAREMLRRAGLDRQGGEPRAPGSVKISFTDTGPEQPLGVVGDVAGADGAGAELVRHLAADVGEGLLDRGDRRAEHRLAVLARPCVRADDGVE